MPVQVDRYGQMTYIVQDFDLSNSQPRFCKMHSSMHNITTEINVNLVGDLRRISNKNTKFANIIWKGCLEIATDSRS